MKHIIQDAIENADMSHADILRDVFSAGDFEHYLRGLGLGVPYYDSEIEELGFDPDTYWPELAQALKTELFSDVDAALYAAENGFADTFTQDGRALIRAAAWRFGGPVTRARLQDDHAFEVEHVRVLYGKPIDRTAVLLRTKNTHLLREILTHGDDVQKLAAAHKLQEKPTRASTLSYAMKVTVPSLPVGECERLAASLLRTGIADLGRARAKGADAFVEWLENTYTLPTAYAADIVDAWRNGTVYARVIQMYREAQREKVEEFAGRLADLMDEYSIDSIGGTHDGEWSEIYGERFEASLGGALGDYTLHAGCMGVDAKDLRDGAE